MQQKRVIFLVILGALLALLGIVTMQYMLTLVILVFVVIVLLIIDCKNWVESLVDKIAAGNRSGSPELTEITESVAAMRTQLARIEKRLDALEKTGKE
jgi:hypothetical protein